MQLYIFPSTSVIAKLLILFSFYVFQYKNNEASVLAAFAYFLLSNVKLNLHYEALCQKLPNNLLFVCPNWDSRTGQLTRQYKTGITTVKPAQQQNCNCYLSNSQSMHKEILPGTQKTNKICIHESG